MEIIKSIQKNQPQNQIWIPSIGFIHHDDLERFLSLNLQIKSKNVILKREKTTLPRQKTRIESAESADNLAEFLIAKQDQPAPIQPPIQTLATGQRTMVLCPNNPNKIGIAKLTYTTRCQNCPNFRGFNTASTVLPRVVCSQTGLPKLLELYSSCGKFKRSVKLSNSRFCLKCKAFTGIDVTTGLVKCASNQGKQRLVSMFPNLTPSFYFPFPIQCAKTKSGATIGTGTIDTCKQCFLFKGLYKNKAGYVKVRCQHSQAVESQYVSAYKKKKSNFSKGMQKRQHREKKISLAWLFDGVFEKKRPHSVVMQVACVDRLHFAVDLNANCSEKTTLKHCRTCDKFKGLSPSFNVNCKAFASSTIFVDCPHSGSPVRLQTCTDCPQFIKISGEKVRCRFTPIQRYVNKEPKPFKIKPFSKQKIKPYLRRNKKTHGKLTGKPKFYYDSQD